MENIYLALLLVGAYLLGSIPSAVWVGRWFFGVDVREHGSKNAGATNTFRILGKKAGIPVLFFDVFKGWLAVRMFGSLSPYELDSDQYINFKIALGVLAVIGHIFPVYVRFKGGKGVATLLGIILALHFEAAVVAFIVFLVVFVVSKYVSLGAIVTAAFFPFILIYGFKEQSASLQYFATAVSILLILTHRKNIYRLLRKQENKMELRLWSKNNK
ncbi:MAG: glycerol-3-phosphate 1-O-acyltransferase PlsY [Bacteroidia bacterium]